MATKEHKGHKRGSAAARAVSASGVAAPVVVKSQSPTARALMRLSSSESVWLRVSRAKTRAG